tara:strand:- start:6765 stop:7517 length:753 start_codon:yes stop_codon:yes gene_type:complete
VKIDTVKKPAKQDNSGGEEESTQSTSKSTTELSAAGVHIGYSRSRRHPSVKQFLFGKKDHVDIFDLVKTQENLSEAVEFVKELSKDGKTILFVGTKPETRDIVKAGAEDINMPYVSDRWIGGLFTNFAEVSKRIKRLLELREEKKDDGFSKYTKKEQGKIHKEMDDLIRKFGGVADITKLPDALIVVDSRHEDIAVTEALCMGIPVIALASSDCDVTKITYPVPGNDASTKSVSYFVDKIVSAYKESIVK